MNLLSLWQSPPLQVQLPEKIVVYELSSGDDNDLKYTLKVSACMVVYSFSRVCLGRQCM